MFPTRQIFMFIFRFKHYCTFSYRLLFRNIFHACRCFYILLHKKHFKFSQYFLSWQWVFVFRDPRSSALIHSPQPSAPILSALCPKNIARTNLWIKHITYSRLYLFKIKTLYLFKIFKKLFRKAKLWCPK